MYTAPPPTCLLNLVVLLVFLPQNGRQMPPRIIHVAMPLVFLLVLLIHLYLQFLHQHRYKHQHLSLIPLHPLVGPLDSQRNA